MDHSKEIEMFRWCLIVNISQSIDSNLKCQSFLNEQSESKTMYICWIISQIAVTISAVFVLLQ